MMNIKTACLLILNTFLISFSSAVQNVESFQTDDDFYDEAFVPPVIKASTYYDLGYKQGRMFASHYKFLISMCRFLFGRIVKSIDKKLSQHIDILKKYYPGFLERIEGLADSINTSEYGLLAYEMILSDISVGCTITGVNGNVTKDGKRYLSWNLDLPIFYKILFSRYFRPPPIMICDIEGKYRYVEVSVIPSLFGFGLLNEKGLSCVYAMVVSNDMGEGLTPLELNHLAMETCSSVEEVMEIYENNERESGVISLKTVYGLTATLSSIWSDSDGEQMLVEYNHSSVVFVYSDILAETNHYQYLIANDTLGKCLIGSLLRLKRAYELLNNYSGSIDEDFYMNILCRDHENFLKGVGDAADICRHSLTFGTVYCIIIKPDDLLAYYCPGHPCRVGFRLIDLSEIMESI